ncbi:hypothetical protein BW723_16000 [Polaribacter reichenbachii]|uniref:Uncharacterized protein n=1 Tax=Polaribacter reichenbachii TaxID=996801 RepID=A0A1B8U2Y1_9FLAO|nr:hypothetical protein [Polaribacter reichenbachii]APZ47703.1 hypothetical protein BW723_16000 [Polaribacter reichenbachii]AUC18342.1 hypothetical protein BTO17_06440 [Polaribacter reichenbachii]OBY66228.1 hypothetical protein LPB301_06935 [Polaribacter reichenbachii]
MSKTLKIILGVLGTAIIAIFGLIMFGLYLMEDEDRYGDLVYFNQKVEDGDIIFRCKYSGELGQTTEFNEYGIIDRSWGSVYVWDNQNTIKQDLYDWAEKGNGTRVRVFRIKKNDFNMNKVELKDGTYNYLMNSGKMEFVTENY